MKRAGARASVETRRWTRREYGRMIDTGILREDEPIELIEWRLIVAEPQNTPHAKAIELAADALRAAFGPGWRIRVQLPIALEPDSEPEPDVSVIAGSPRDDREDHPSHPALVVEVADTSIRLDRTVKARIYARGGIPEYWIVNLIARVVEVHRRRPPAVGFEPLTPALLVLPMIHQRRHAWSEGRGH